jgi:AcrR family transcriptional regulator
MADQDKETLILDAARKVFVEKGPVNARMQDIADEADITPSLLHYYYRKRDALYEAVVEQEIRRLIPAQLEILTSNQPVAEKLSDFARGVIDFHASNPHHAAFVAFEAHYNDNHLKKMGEAFKHLDLSVMQTQLDERAAAGDEVPTDARQLLMHVLSLCIFPFIAQPIFQSIYDMEDEAYQAMMEKRKEEVPLLIQLALRECS